MVVQLKKEFVSKQIYKLEFHFEMGRLLYNMSFLTKIQWYTKISFSTENISVVSVCADNDNKKGQMGQEVFKAI